MTRQQIEEAVAKLAAEMGDAYEDMSPVDVAVHIAKLQVEECAKVFDWCQHCGLGIIPDKMSICEDCCSKPDDETLPITDTDIPAFLRGLAPTEGP
jgi:hypothetical protein